MPNLVARCGRGRLGSEVEASLVLSYRVPDRADPKGTRSVTLAQIMTRRQRARGGLSVDKRIGRREEGQKLVVSIS